MSDGKIELLGVVSNEAAGHCQVGIQDLVSARSEEHLGDFRDERVNWGCMDGSVEHRLLRLADKLDELAWSSLHPWIAVGLDPAGGAYGFLDRHFLPQFADERQGAHRLGPSGERKGDQTLVQQARHLFSYSLAATWRPSEPKLSEFAHRLYGYLILGFLREEAPREHRARLPPLARNATEIDATEQARRVVLERPLLNWVPRGGGAATLTDDPGRAGDFFESSCASPYAVQLYSQSFAIYGLATYGKAFGVVEAIAQARALFGLLDAARHDEQGYDQTIDGGWLALVGAPDGTAKCTNTHIHILEALTVLCDCLPQDQLVSQRLLELTRLVAGKLLQPDGYVHQFFSRSGMALGPPEVSFGHDLETSWLLLSALEVLQKFQMVDLSTAQEVEQASRTMAEHALRGGWDPDGGVFDSGVVAGGGRTRVARREKIWWVQAETLPALYCLYQRTGRADLLTRLEQAWAFLSRRSWDPDGGEFFWAIGATGKPSSRGTHKGEIWKTPYHGLRALVLTAAWIRKSVGK